MEQDILVSNFTIQNSKFSLVTTKGEVAEENLDELLNQLQECKCKVVKPNETTWVLDRSECNLCHEKIL